jgi:thymidylate synthase
LGELFWYLAGSESIDFIKHYIQMYPKFSNDGVTASGAYGPRIFGLNAKKKAAGKSEWDRVIKTLKKNPGSRNALIQIFSNRDEKPRNKDKPCTCTIQFAIRNNRLQMHTHMRSNDAFLGLPHDIFSFTMLQEIAARELSVGLGTYIHSVTSLHLYHDRDAAEKLGSNNSTSLAKAYFDEGLHDFVPMPEMPIGDPWVAIEAVKEAEKAIRQGNDSYVPAEKLDPYWMDIIELFRIYKIFQQLSIKSIDKADRTRFLRKIIAATHEVSDTYQLYIRDRLEKEQTPARDLFEYMGIG